jgi:phosphatidylinositol-3-phosphatase
MKTTRFLASLAALVAVSGCGGAAAPAAPARNAAGSSPALVIPSLPAPTVTATAATPATQAAPPPAAGPPHVMVIVMENREASSVLGRPDAPYITSLATGYGQATRWYGVSHPSLPNYLAMISGSDQGVHDDGTGYTFGGPTLVDQLAGRGIGWKAYMEDMPSPCFGGGSSGSYAKKHDPFVYFSSITGNSGQCARVVPHGQLAGDLQAGTAPPFLFVTPNMCNDGHDCGNATADGWLKGEMQMVMGSSWYRQGGSVIVTWDEGGSNAGCCGGAAGGQIATIVVTAAGQRRLDTAGDHYGMLRALEEAYGVGYLGRAADPASGDLRPLLAG